MQPGIPRSALHFSITLSSSSWGCGEIGGSSNTHYVVHHVTHSIAHSRPRNGAVLVRSISRLPVGKLAKKSDQHLQRVCSRAACGFDGLTEPELVLQSPVHAHKDTPLDTKTTLKFMLIVYRRVPSHP